jgi:metal-sulfur cluster biosynthetic enzyme
MIVTVSQLISELEERDPQAFIEIRGLGEIEDIETDDDGTIVLVSGEVYDQ